MLNIPPHWKTAKLGEACKLKNGFAFSSKLYIDKGIPVIRISDIKSGIVSSKNSVRVNKSTNYENYLVEEGDILVAMSGATTGKFGIFKSKELAYQNQRVGKFQILNKSVLNNLFLFYQIYALKRQIEKDAYGGAQPNISSTKIEGMDIILPPLPEQHLIVAKIEELFSELDNAVENLKKAKEQLKVYRQAVLKWAFEGKLTEEWRTERESQNTKYQSEKEEVRVAAEECIEYSKSNSFPKDWYLLELNQLGKWNGGGTPSKSNNLFWENGTILWVSPKDMKSKYITDTQDKISEIAIEGSSTKLIEKNSILFVVRSGILRRILPIAITKSKVTLNQDMQAFTPNQNISSEYVYWFCTFNEFNIRNSCAKDGTTVESIETKALKSFKIVMTNLDEQIQIVQEIETRFSVADKLEQSIDQSLQQAEALRQSILKRAFEGEIGFHARTPLLGGAGGGYSPSLEGLGVGQKIILDMKRKILPYNPALKQLASKLRKNMTLSEVLLWNHLKQKKMKGYDFDRQRP